MPKHLVATRFFRDWLPGKWQVGQLLRHLPPTRETLAGNSVFIAV